MYIGQATRPLWDHAFNFYNRGSNTNTTSYYLVDVTGICIGATGAGAGGDGGCVCMSE